MGEQAAQDVVTVLPGSDRYQYGFTRRDASEYVQALPLGIDETVTLGRPVCVRPDQLDAPPSEGRLKTPLELHLSWPTGTVGAVALVATGDKMNS